MNIQDNELFKSGMKNIDAAMDKIKFSGNMAFDELDIVRGHIGKARADFAVLSDVEPDHYGVIDKANKFIDLVEKTLNAVDDSSHLI